MPNILVINGSTREASTNGLFIKAIIKLAADLAHFTVFPSIADLPQFNPDLDVDPAPIPVSHFRTLLATADGILICTPEYAMGVPGSLKNALDWTVSTADFRAKPVMLVTASLSGEKAQASLIDTLKVIEALLDAETTALVKFARTKVNSEGVITDAEALADVQRALEAFMNSVARILK
ncbi:MAG: NAD(P)H-dependent oxidoreductase [Flavobacteriales bacterium]|nr:NAD(P)H-dependent oxidoreductase [Flavobacteriales bacterium]MBK6945394.1 NAD(P)H-dependent oxidoreductase [Flavobacteriales bacterium]MBK7241511.1 NAD(P)H-dependent oxidoreductase [Flavobacteriales bacterium]MBK9535047.1 NAD(P)H-dependent oxidoreductase [Flavobacteriales bacterium]MBP9139303.1 NAD(P)H-dependent oxidoreductase [Flavobacteriales bacterium]